MYLSLGMKLTKIHRVLKFKQPDSMKKYIDFNNKKGRNAANSLLIVLKKIFLSYWLIVHMVKLSKISEKESVLV